MKRITRLFLLLLIISACAGGTRGTGGITVTGRVFESDRTTPISNLSVRIAETGESSVTDSEGGFEISSTASTSKLTLELAGEGILTAVNLEGLDESIKRLESEIVVDRQTNSAKVESTITSTVFDPVLISGVLVNELDGSALSGSSVALSGTNISTTTDSAGRFSLLADRSQGPVILEVVGLFDVELGELSEDEVEVRLVANPEEGSVQVGSRVTLRGVLINVTDGSPFAQTEIRVIETNESLLTDQQGHFSFEVPASLQEVNLVVVGLFLVKISDLKNEILLFGDPILGSVTSRPGGALNTERQITGTMLNEITGMPYPEVKVEVLLTGEFIITGDDGVFQFDVPSNLDKITIEIQDFFQVSVENLSEPITIIGNPEAGTVVVRQ